MKTSGSKDAQDYQDDPETTHGPKGKRGRPSKSKQEKKIGTHCEQQIEQRQMEQE